MNEEDADVAAWVEKCMREDLLNQPTYKIPDGLTLEELIAWFDSEIIDKQK